MIAIMRATFGEAARRKTFIVMGSIAILFQLLWGILLHYALRMDIPGGLIDTASYLLTTMGLQFASMLLALLTIMLAAGSVASDLDTGLSHGILSRPIRRAEYILGKFIGLVLITAAFATAFYALLLIIGGLSGLVTITALSIWRILGGWLLFLTAPLAVLCLTLWGSTRFRTVPNGILMIFIYILGNIGGMVELVGQLLSSRSVSSAGVFLSLISPFHVLYLTCEEFIMPSASLAQNAARFAGGLSGGGNPPSTLMYVYIGIYAVAFMLFALRSFSKKDII
ncbi:MAG: ABC transporter permease subunit [Oscillospiraceae bacterium]|nr:ABC transporter permease subunit [Oscillospiraceae bacterium]